MEKWILIIISIFFIFSCVSDKVTIRAVTTKAIHEIIVKKNIEELQVFLIFENVKEIEGLIKLKNLKRLYILGLYGITDFSFLSQLTKLEALILEECDIENFNFLQALPNLRIFYLDGVRLIKNELNFIYNRKLEYIAFFRLRAKQPNTYFDLNILNIPDNLQFIDLSINRNVKLTKELFDRMQNVPIVLLTNEYYYENKEILSNYKNIYIEDSKKILPEEYWMDSLLEGYEYKLTYTD